MVMVMMMVMVMAMVVVVTVMNWMVLTISPENPDGDADEENFRGWSVSSHHPGGGESLLPAIWGGEVLFSFTPQWGSSLGTNQLPFTD